MNFKKEIEKYVPQTQQEEWEKVTMLQYIDLFYDNILYRSSLLAHMTASSMIFNETKDKVLMIYHNIYQSWSWTGGHTDGEENLQKVALKEAEEETGIKAFQMLKNGIVSIDILTVEGHYKKEKYVHPHIHFNVTYCFEASEKNKLILNENETKGVQWIPISDIKSHCKEEKMIPIYEKIIKRVQ